ncbi:MAG: hypothetical protein QOJ86_1409 [Bradyrhizobium sp.]|nr:hypothetical protein [Bradyrhizobium sp.]
MREIRSSGSVRGASGDGRPYRERYLAARRRAAKRPESTPLQTSITASLSAGPRALSSLIESG